MNKDKETLAKEIYGSDASEILDFLSEVAPDKEMFRNEETFLNFVAAKLMPLLNKKARNGSSEVNVTFWKCRAQSMHISMPYNKKRNVLWAIRLLSGKCNAPE